ncbi:MAG: hypothetical protein E7022_07630 [Desulfovibrio desulfuricans]|nr:hypothetical protein [Desulfovibrio desulfuricans]
MNFSYAPIGNTAERDAIFLRMEAEGLLGCAMSALAAPTLAQWRAVTAPEQGVLLGCYAQAATRDARPAPLLACGLFSPRRGRVWEFDFTTFRATAHLAVDMARGGLGWAFARLDCAAVMGVCPAPNRHAWRLATACGFRLLGRLPGACRYARRNAYVDGVFVLCTPADLEATKTPS